MDAIKKFHIAWHERQKYVRRFRPVFILFIICWSILLIVDILLLYKENLGIGLLLLLFLAFCLWHIFIWSDKAKQAKYKDLFENYLNLLQTIKENPSEAHKKGYDDIFYEYEKFMNIEYEVTASGCMIALHLSPATKEYSIKKLKTTADERREVKQLMEKEERSRASE